MGKDYLKKFERKISSYRLIALDSSCFIYHIEENKDYIPFTEIIFEKLLPEGITTGVCSTLILTEVLTQPLREKKHDLVLMYKSLIVGFPYLALKPFDASIAEKSAYFRAKYNLRTPDAIHIATAYEAKAEAILGNDDAWKKVKEIPVILLNDFVDF